MKQYKEYERLYEQVDQDWGKDIDKSGDVIASGVPKPSDYAIFGLLMKDIMDTVKLPNNRDVALSCVGSFKEGYMIKSRVDLVKLISSAIALSASMDKTVSDNDLIELMDKYYYPHGMNAYYKYTNLVKREAEGRDYNVEERNNR